MLMIIKQQLNNNLLHYLNKTLCTYVTCIKKEFIKQVMNNLRVTVTIQPLPFLPYFLTSPRNTSALWT